MLGPAGNLRCLFEQEGVGRAGLGGLDLGGCAFRLQKELSKSCYKLWSDLSFAELSFRTAFGFICIGLYNVIFVFLVPAAFISRPKPDAQLSRVMVVVQQQ